MVDLKGTRVSIANPSFLHAKPLFFGEITRNAVGKIGLGVALDVNADMLRVGAGGAAIISPVPKVRSSIPSKFFTGWLYFKGKKTVTNQPDFGGFR
jgi:hypothetical protein